MNPNAAARFLAVFAFFSAAIAGAADLRPVIEIDTGYFFGASGNGK